MCCSSHFPQKYSPEKYPKVFTRKISKSIQNYSPEKFAKVYKSIHQKNSPEEFRNGSVGAWSVGIVPSTHFVMITCVLFFRTVIIIVILWLWLLLLGFAFQPLHLELPQLFPFLQCVDVVLLLLFCNVIVIILWLWLWLLVFAFQKLHLELPSPFPFLQCVNVVLYRYYHFVLLLFFFILLFVITFLILWLKFLLSIPIVHILAMRCLIL